MAFAISSHNSRTLRATNMRGWWVLLLASACLGDDCSNISCEFSEKNVCAYDSFNKIHAFFDDNCVMAKCNCRFEAVGSTARFLEMDTENCTKDPYVSFIDECSPDTSSEGPQESDIPSSEEIVLQPKDNDTINISDLIPEDSLEDVDVSRGEDANVSDLLDTSNDEVLPILSIVPSKEIDPSEDSEENDSVIDQETGPFIIDSGRMPPPPPPFPLELGKLGSMLLHGLAGNLEQNVERKHDPSGQTIIKADIDVNVYIDEKMPFPRHHKPNGHHPHEDSEEQSDESSYEGNEPMPFEGPGPQHHKHHGHHPHEDSEEQNGKPTFEVNVPVPMENPDLPILTAESNVPIPSINSELPIPSAVHQYPTAGSALPKLNFSAMLLTSILAILRNRY